MSHRNIAKLLCLKSLVIAIVFGVIPIGAQAESPSVRIPPQVKPVEKPAEKEEKAVLTFIRKGGFAGFSDDLTIYSDFTFEKKGPRHRPKLGKKGKLTADQQATLKKLLATYGKVKWSRGNAPNVADGMQEAITISGTGKKTKLSPKDAEFRQISKLAGDILRGVK